MATVDHVFKIVLTGDSLVGKSSLLLQYSDDYFSEEIQSTIGVDFKVKVLELVGPDGTVNRIKTTIWDTAGDEKYRTLTTSYYRGLHAIIIVYDVSSKDSFDGVTKWFVEIEDYCEGKGQKAVKFLVGNKTDVSERQISAEEGKARADELGIQYAEVSCKLDHNVKELFHVITNTLLAKVTADPMHFGKSTASVQAKKVKSAEEVAAENSATIAEALAQGSKEWRRSKFSVVGEGRAGKTAFTNAVVGKAFEETASTVGINQLTCDVKHVKSGAGGETGGQQWGEIKRDGREYEMALAELMVLNKKKEQAVQVEKVDIRNFMQIISRLGQEQDVSEPVNLFDQRPQQEPVRPVFDTFASVATADSAYDEEMVMKMLATLMDEESGLQISLFDFGGQAVFDVIHHLFLTRNGVYALVFNMEWLTHDGPEKDKALRFMRSWLSSIAVHTFDKNTQMTAPIVLVGTRQDLVPSPAVHEQISTLLHEHFSDNLAWRSVVENDNGHDSNGKAIQCFFPVDNKLGKQGATMQQLMGVVHRSIESAAYTQKQVPLTWFKLIDQMSSSKKDCLALTDVSNIAAKCGLTEPEIPLFLSFLHDMGHLMWHDEPELRDVVILDPVSYLVTPATIIICKLRPDKDDSTHHSMPSHRECAKLHKHEWTALKNDGVLNTKLLPILWKDYMDHSHVLLLLMVKFGLLVALRSADVVKGSAPSILKQFMVPTLLAPAPTVDPAVLNWTGELETPNCFFVFTLAQELESKSTIMEADLKSMGFLPSGMFERLVGRALSWSQDTAKGSCIDLQSVMLYKDMAVLSFGRQRFRIVHCADIHCVRVDIEGRNPMAVQQKLLNLIVKIIDECMTTLCCFPAVSYASTTASMEGISLTDAHTGLKKALLPTELLIPFNQLRKAAKGESNLAWRGGRTLLNMTEIKNRYGQWLQQYTLRERYDVFISYRWSDRGKPQYDSDFTEALFDMFSNFSVGEQSRAVEVFLDRKRLQDGRLFKSDFAAALCNTLVAVPVVTMEALNRMLDHSADRVDNVLLEWIMMIEAFAAKRILNVYPVMFGTRRAANTLAIDSQEPTPSTEAPMNASIVVQNFFADYDQLTVPDIVPAATLAQAEELLRANGVPLSAHFATHTVRSVLLQMQQYLLCLASDYDSSELVETFAGKVVDLLSKCGAAELAKVAAGADKAHTAPASSTTTTLPAALPTSSHSAAPIVASTSASTPLQDLTIDSLRQLLERTSLPKVATIFAENQVTGEMLSYCEQPSDLLAAEFGLTSEAVARGVMKHVKRWIEHGVQ